MLQTTSAIRPCMPPLTEKTAKLSEFSWRAGADVDAKNSFGETALHRAILKGDSDLVRMLVDAGADVNITNAFGDSALSRAVHEGNKEILQILANARDN